MRTPDMFCPLCRCELNIPETVRAHLIANHKRKAAERGEPMMRFDTATPTEPELHIYCAHFKLESGPRFRSDRKTTPGKQDK